MRISKKLTEEEKVALKISTIISDLRLDLEMVGIYLAIIVPSVAYNRFIQIAESAHHKKENRIGSD